MSEAPIIDAANIAAYRGATIDAPEEFFLNSGSDQLEKIYRWARARYAAPWAVFFGVLLRVAASVPPSVQLPPVIGGRASLNLFCAFAGKSGSGKGVSDNVARAAWPDDIIELPIGSGEGIAEQFSRGKAGAAGIPVIFTASEIDKIAGIAGRAGSILLAELKAAAMGEPIGQANAKEDTTRIVVAHSYRMCLSVGAQPGHTGVLFNDTTGGTPQRFLWAPTTDPSMPDTATEPPPPLDTALPIWEPGEDGVVEVVYGPPEIKQTIVAAHIARQRGEGNALDGHILLMRCKVAALLGIMHGRVEVNQWDWDMSAEVMAVSEQTRTELVDHGTKAAIEQARREGEKRAAINEAQARYALESVKASIVRFLAVGEQAGGDLKRRLGSSTGRRKFFDEAIAELIDENAIEPVRVTGGTRYRLIHCGHGDQTGHPTNSHVKAGDRPGHGDHGGSATDPDNHQEEKAGKATLSCQKWFDQHIAERVAAGETIVESSAVYDAGRAAGYSDGSLYVAKTKRRDIPVADRRGRKGCTWSLAKVA
ncbi:hypothetical protein [Mycolicibacterium neoaurum]|uniref:Uncharacterized protein n=1 Tax=Mycolicibacterium neoaurum TaxID=1795 RepID=A0AAV2WN98_MYCNE|nr:hypothetical protein [Mycolicibacterium neoaurum]TLH57904.1 hypothetical protein C1S81_15520 [Mycolicibacterium neoaurum]CDQ45689.1 hypothetical protein BN1047_03589 [Mycolicibacterium neoaurum]